MTIARTRQPKILAAALILTLAGCAEPEVTSPSSEETGRVVLSITNAPGDASCLRITVKGATTAVRSLPLMTNASTTFTLEGLPAGTVVFTAEAFSVGCPSVSAESVVSWVSDAVSAMLVPGQTSNIALQLHRPGRANVSVDFPMSCSMDSACPAGLACIGGVCTQPTGSCMVNSDCPSGVCVANVCKKANGAACAMSTECASGLCSGGVCAAPGCGSAASCPVGEMCVAGLCKKPDGASCMAGSQCVSGLCAAGVCKKANGAACMASSECGSGLCSGGVCTAAACGGAGQMCCAGSVCSSGTVCLAGTCSAGPALQWKFDESSGTTALDASGNGLRGTYVGAETPLPSTLRPAAGSMGNPSSRAFDRTKQQAVRLAATPLILKPTNGLTVSAWYRATSVDTSGAELVSAGDNYILRLRKGQVEFAKHIVVGGFATCAFPSSTHLDGAWHHVAAVSSTEGMKVYFDGMESCTNLQGEDLLYDRGPDFWVGRHGNNSTAWDFDGNIDDVRVYRRALTASEITALFAAAQ